MAVPVLLDLESAVDRLRARQRTAAVGMLDRRRTELRALLRHLPAGAEVTALSRQALDRAAAQLPAALRARHDRTRLNLARLGGRLAAQSPHAILARTAQKLVALKDRLDRGRLGIAERRRLAVGTQAARLGTAFVARLRLLGTQQSADRTRLTTLAGRLDRAGRSVVAVRAPRVDGLAQLLRSLGYRSVLARGYALVRDPEGHAVRSAEALRQTAVATVEFTDGRVTVQPQGDGALMEQSGRPARPSRSRRGDAGAPVAQPSLFDG